MSTPVLKPANPEQFGPHPELPTQWPHLWTKFWEIFQQEWKDELVQLLGDAKFVALGFDRFQFFLSSLTQPFHVRTVSLEHDGQIIELCLDDRPFIVRTFYSYLEHKGMKLNALQHPIFALHFHNKELQDINLAKKNTGNVRSYVMAWVADTDKFDWPAIEAELTQLYGDLMVVVDDFPKTRAGIEDAMLSFEAKDSITMIESEQKAILQWYLQGNLLAFGFGVVRESKAHQQFTWSDLSQSAGYLRLWQNLPAHASAEKLIQLQTALQLFLRTNLRNSFLELGVVNAINRHETLLLALHKFTNQDQQAQILMIPCIFSSQSYEDGLRKIPILRLKLNGVLESLGYLEESYNYKELMDYFNHFPRQEIFRLERDEMRALWKQIQGVYDVNRLAAFIIQDVEHGYLHLTFLVALSAYQPNLLPDILTKVEKKIGRAHHHFYSFQYKKLQHIHCIAFLDWESVKAFDVKALEREILTELKSWDDSVSELLAIHPTLAGNHKLHTDFLADLPVEYKDIVSPIEVLADFEELLQLNIATPVRGLIHKYGTNQSLIRIYAHKQFHLRSSFKIMESLGLEVEKSQSYAIALSSGDQTSLESSYVHRYVVNHVMIAEEARDDFHARLMEVLLQLLPGEIPTDGLWELLTKTTLPVKAVQLLKLYRNYLNQISTGFSSDVINRVLLDYPRVAEKLFGFFAAKFKPGELPQDLATLTQELDALISQSHSVLEDNLLKALFSLLNASVRTNYYLPAGQESLAVKFDCALTEAIPAPKPKYEIYVFSEWYEGTHLRGGKIARGGIRYSDRKDDFRQEVLNLMLTQQLKNVVIVPVGSKGGFILKKTYPDQKSENVEVPLYYQKYIAQLLSLTDNLVDGQISRPKDMVVYDEDDPYLVVAADKGTANFSDLANQISLDHQFWLGDAFAAGGSHGFNHKALAITARGAWEGAKIHFMKLGRAMDSSPFTVVGIGDMSGDVFGNGMLLSKQIALVGAFNHVHIFIDIAPDLEKSYAERKRLFELSSSTWLDYNPSEIGHGGVFMRAAKAIPLTLEMRNFLETTRVSVSGEELIRLLLTAKVDMLYNGGIGVYIKSSQESHSEVGDKANIAVRVDAQNLRAKMVIEGGNLGVTALARIEYSLNKGLINSDAIDNSAGVDMSDHEVNLKILFKSWKELADMEARDSLLAELAPEICELCLRDNREQSHRIALDAEQSNAKLAFFLMELKHLERVEGLDRKHNAIPTDQWFYDLDKKAQPLPMPILAVFMSHLKNYVYHRILRSQIPDIPEMEDKFVSYFPPTLQARFNLHGAPHPLKREIIATGLANQFINDNGCFFLSQIYAAVAQKAIDIIYGVFIVEALFPSHHMRALIFNEVSPDKYQEALALVLRLDFIVKERVIWFLCNFTPAERNFSLVAQYKKVIDDFKAQPLAVNCTLEPEGYEQQVAKLCVLGFSSGLAEEYARFTSLDNPLETSRLHMLTGLSFQDIQAVVSNVAERFLFDAMELILLNAHGDDEWQRSYIGLLLLKLNQIKKKYLTEFGRYYERHHSFDKASEWLEERQQGLSNFRDEWLRFEKAPKDMFSGISLFLERLDQVFP